MKTILKRMISVIMVLALTVSLSACGSRKRKMEKVEKNIEKYEQSFDYVMVCGTNGIEIQSNVYGNFTVTSYETDTKSIGQYLGGDSTYLYYSGWETKNNQLFQKTIWRIPLAEPRSLELVVGYDANQYAGALMPTSDVYILYEEDPEYAYEDNPLMVPSPNAKPESYQYTLHGFEVGTNKLIDSPTNGLSFSLSTKTSLSSWEKEQFESLLSRENSRYRKYDVYTPAFVDDFCVNEYLKEIKEEGKYGLSFDLHPYDINLQNGAYIAVFTIEDFGYTDTYRTNVYFLFDGEHPQYIIDMPTLPQQFLTMYPL